MKPTKEDLRVAAEVIEGWHKSIADSPRSSTLELAIASAIAAEREKAAKIVESYASNAPTVCQQAAAEIRAGDKE